MAWAWVMSVVLLYMFLIRTKPSYCYQRRSGYDTNSMKRVWNNGTRYSFLGPRTLSTVKFGINLRLFRIVFYYLQWILHELHLILYFQLSHYWTRNFYLFTRTNLRLGKADQLSGHLQYILAFNEYIFLFALTLIRGCRAFYLEWNLTLSISE